MSIPFEVDGRYRNRNGSYQVLSIEGNQMTILYENGRVQSVNIQLQAHIWENLQWEETAAQTQPYRVNKEDEGLDSRPINELVQEVLHTNFKSPYPTDIIDRVCLALEQNPEWLNWYQQLVQHFSSQGKYGKLTVNSSIGWYTKDLTGMVTLKAGNPAKSSLIESYSTLAYRSDE